MSGRRRAGLWAAGLVLASVSSPVRAGPPARASAGAPAEDPLAKVSALARDAQTRFETADYEGAIDLWTQAYAALPDDASYGHQRSVLAYQIAQACVEAYAIDPQLSYLRKAERLFESYLAGIDAKDLETRAEVQHTLDELRRKIAEAEARDAMSVEARAAEAAERERAAAAERERAEARRRDEQAQARRAAAEREARRWRGVAIAGGVVLGVGVVGLGVMSYGLAAGAGVDRRGEAARRDGVDDPLFYTELLREGTAANRLAIALGAVGGALVVTGAGLVGAGVSGQRRARRELAWAPVWLAGGAGLTVRGSF